MTARTMARNVTRASNRGDIAGSFAASSGVEDASLEQLRGQRHARRLQPLHALRADAGGLEIALGHPVAVNAGLLEDEQVVHADHVPLHTRDLRNLDDL